MTEAESRQVDLLTAQARAAGQARLDEQKRVAGHIMQAVDDAKSPEVIEALVDLTHRIFPGARAQQEQGR